MAVNSVIFQGDASPWNDPCKNILHLENEEIKAMVALKWPVQIDCRCRPMRKLRRCPAQDQSYKNANFCHFDLFWQNSGYWSKIQNFDIAAKCSTFYKCAIFYYFFSDMLRKKGSFYMEKVTFTPKKKHFFRLYLQRAQSCHCLYSPAILACVN